MSHVPPMPSLPSLLLARMPHLTCPPWLPPIAAVPPHLSLRCGLRQERQAPATPHIHPTPGAAGTRVSALIPKPQFPAKTAISGNAVRPPRLHATLPKCLPGTGPRDFSPRTASHSLCVSRLRFPATTAMSTAHRLPAHRPCPAALPPGASPRRRASSPQARRREFIRRPRIAAILALHQTPHSGNNGKPRQCLASSQFRAQPALVPPLLLRNVTFRQKRQFRSPAKSRRNDTVKYVNKADTRGHFT